MKTAGPKAFRVRVPGPPPLITIRDWYNYQSFLLEQQIRENEKSPVKYVNKGLYEDIFSTRFIVPRDSLKQNSESPVWTALKIPADLIIKNVDTINSRYSRVGKITLQITVTAIFDA